MARPVLALAGVYLGPERGGRSSTEGIVEAPDYPTIFIVPDNLENDLNEFKRKEEKRRVEEREKAEEDIEYQKAVAHRRVLIQQLIEEDRLFG